MRFEVLGPIQAMDGSHPVGPVSAMRRRLLAVLLVRANRAVSTDLLAEVLWGDDLPERPAKSLHIHVHRLRQVLDRPDRLAATPGGYLLHIAPGELDSDEFHDLVGQARRARESGDLDGATAFLRAALDLWRGPPYSDVDDGLVVETEARRLAELRMIAREELYETELARGHARTIVPELAEMVAEYPLRERFVGQFMLALYRSGRQARALTAFRSARQRLARELGVEPGRELRDLHAAVLAEDGHLLGEPTAENTVESDAGDVAPDPVRPAQLPPSPASFVGRDEAITALDDLIADAEEAATIVISGMAGVGKTALALRYAHRAADRFSDGQLYIDLRGHSTEPARQPLEALGQLLRSLGADPAIAGDSVEAATAQFRSQLAGHKVLVVLDNAVAVEQVRPLLASTIGCATVITSRHRLPSLTAGEGAHRLAVDILPRQESRELLSRLLGRERLDAESEAVDALIEQCAGLPLALRIAAAQLGDERHRAVADYVAELSERGLSAFALDDDEHSAVAAAFDLSYQHLAPDVRRCFRALGLVPGSDVTAGALAALTATTPEHARVMLRKLIGTNLIDEHAAGRFRLHDLLREYVRTLVAAEDPPADQAASRVRLYSWYYQGKEAAVAFLGSHPRRPPQPDIPDGVPAVVFEHERDAANWLMAEFGNLAAAARASLSCPSTQPWSWHLVLGAAIPAARRGLLTETLPLLHDAVGSARAAGDRHALAHALNELGAVRTLSSIAVSDDLVSEVLEHAEHVGDVALQAYCLYMAGVAKARTNDYTTATASLERSLELYRQIDDHGGQALALNQLGGIAQSHGDLRRAVQRWEKILTLDETSATRSALSNLTSTRLMLGEFDGIESTIRRADRLAALHDDRAAACVLMLIRAEWHRALGQVDAAVEQLGEALHLADELAIPRLQTGILAELGFCLLTRGELGAAGHQFERAAEIAGRAELRSEGSYAARGHAETQLAAGDHGSAFLHARTALTLAGDLHRVHRADALVALGAAELADGRIAPAVEYAEAAVAIHREAEHHLGLARAHRLLGSALIAGGDDATRAHGAEHLRSSLRRFETAGSPEAAAVAAHLAAVKVTRNPTEAARW